MLELDTNFSETGTMDLNYGENMLHFEFIDSKLSASVCNDEGEFAIQPYNLQEQLKSISNLSTLEAYFANAFFKVKELDDGEFKLEVNQKGYGGSGMQRLYGDKITGKPSNGCYGAIGAGVIGGAISGDAIGAVRGAVGGVIGAVGNGNCTFTPPKK